MYDGLICDSSVQVRRIAFHHGSPGHFDGMSLKIALWDQSVQDEIDLNMNPTDRATYLEDVNKEYFSEIEFKSKLNPADGWAIPYVTGH